MIGIDFKPFTILLWIIHPLFLYCHADSEVLHATILRFHLKFSRHRPQLQFWTFYLRPHCLQRFWDFFYIKYKIFFISIFFYFILQFSTKFYNFFTLFDMIIIITLYNNDCHSLYWAVAYFHNDTLGLLFCPKNAFK